MAGMPQNPPNLRPDLAPQARFSEPKREGQPTIGMVLCKSKENTIVEYALRGVTTPIGVSTHNIEQLPAQLQKSLPTVELLQQELNEAAAEIKARSPQQSVEDD